MYNQDLCLFAGFNHMPQYFHFIWFGSCLPKEYQKNILSFKEFNPAYKLYLWTDYHTLAPEDRVLMNDFCTTNGIEIRDIRNQELTNQDLINFELDRALEDRKEMARIHYVRASDLARVAILIKHGGIYNDTDSKSTSALPEEIDLPHGFLSDKTFRNEYNFEINRDALLEVIYYHFMAATPNNAILKLAAEISRLDYKTYHASQHKHWEALDSRQAHMEGTVKLTGTSIKRAINYLRQQGEIKLRYMSELFLDADNFSTSSFDKSWLHDFTSDKEVEESEESLMNFCMEIEKNREQHYPLLSQLSLDGKIPYRDYPTFFDKFSNNYNFDTLFASRKFAPVEIFKYRSPPPINFKAPSIDINFQLPTYSPLHFDLSSLKISFDLVEELKNTIKEVQKEYVNYSLAHCQRSLFHAHGSAGRKRVHDWVQKIDQISDFVRLRTEILDYLQDSTKGKTFKHSFRMMLITRLSEQYNLDLTPRFDDLLEQLKIKWSPSRASSAEEDTVGLNRAVENFSEPELEIQSYENGHSSPNTTKS